MWQDRQHGSPEHVLRQLHRLQFFKLWWTMLCLQFPVLPWSLLVHRDAIDGCMLTQPVGLLHTFIIETFYAENYVICKERHFYFFETYLFSLQKLGDREAHVGAW